jgi:hypothetical protein
MRYDETELPRIMEEILGIPKGTRMQVWKIEEDHRRLVEERQIEEGT